MTATVLSKDQCLRWIRVLALVTWVFGVVWIAFLGLAVRNSLEMQGVALMPLSSAVKLFIPLGLLTLTPLGTFAVLLIHSVQQSFAGTAGRVSRYFLAVIATRVDIKDPKDFPRLLASALGASIGTYVPITLLLTGIASYTGPGGFAEAALLVLFIWPLTLGYLFLQTLLAAAIGGWTFGALYSLIAKLQRSSA